MIFSSNHKGLQGSNNELESRSSRGALKKIVSFNPFKYLHFPIRHVETEEEKEWLAQMHQREHGVDKTSTATNTKGAPHTSGKVKTWVHYQALNCPESHYCFWASLSKDGGSSIMHTSSWEAHFEGWTIAAFITSLRHNSIAQSAPKDKHVIIFQCSGATT